MKLKDQERNIISEATSNIYKVVVNKVFGTSDESLLTKDETSYLKVINTINNYKEA